MSQFRFHTELILRSMCLSLADFTVMSPRFLPAAANPFCANPFGVLSLPHLPSLSHTHTCTRTHPAGCHPLCGYISRYVPGALVTQAGRVDTGQWIGCWMPGGSMTFSVLAEELEAQRGLGHPGNTGDSGWTA